MKLAKLTVEAAQAQAVFRVVLNALSYPGRVLALPALDTPPPNTLEPATAAIARALFDFETPIWIDPRLDEAAIAQDLRLRCGCPITDRPDQAAFALLAGDDPLPEFAFFALGNAYSPQLATTIILQTPALTGGEDVRIHGPGIAVPFDIAPATPVAFWNSWAQNEPRYPLGVDLIMVAGSSIIGLPRTCRASREAEKV